MSFPEKLASRIAARKSQDNLRARRLLESPQRVAQIIDGKKVTSFCSNDYLGLANHPEVIAAARACLEDYGFGSGASHLINGHTREHHLLEEELADFCGQEKALLFSTGYMANVGVINALTDKHDIVYQDKLNHASLLDGAMLSSAKMLRFRHGDMAQLENLFEKNNSTKNNSSHALLVTDGVFSMDGDLANIPELSRISKKNNAWLMVDDAHGLGCLGETGRGSASHLKVAPNDVNVLVGTLGKAFGTFGAFVAGSAQLVDYLVQFCRPYIYTTASPALLARATRCSLRLIQEESWRQKKLKDNITFFRDLCEKNTIPLMESETAIQPVKVGENSKALALSQALLDEGILLTAIRPPTVPEGSARLRVTLCTEHSEAQIEALVKSLAVAFRKQANTND